MSKLLFCYSVFELIFCLIDDAKVGRFSMQNMDFFELSRPTIRHYTYSPFSLYALYAQPTFGHKKSEQKSICSLNIYSVLTAKSSSAAYIHLLLFWHSQHSGSCRH